MMKKFFMLFMVLLPLILFSACSSDDTEYPITNIEQVKTIYGTWNVINNFHYIISDADKKDFPQDGSIWNYIRVQFNSDGTYVFQNGSYIEHHGRYTYVNHLISCRRIGINGEDLDKEYFKIEKCEVVGGKVQLTANYYTESGTSASFVFQKK